jgi:hypothetical protein
MALRDMMPHGKNNLYITKHFLEPHDPNGFGTLAQRFCGAHGTRCAMGGLQQEQSGNRCEDGDRNGTRMDATGEEPMQADTNSTRDGAFFG